MKKKLISIIILIVLVLILTIIIFGRSIAFLSYYYVNYHIFLPYPEKTEDIYCSSGQDYICLEKYKYSFKQIEKLKLKKYFKKIGNKSQYLNDLLYEFPFYLIPKEKINEIVDNLTLFKENNYYAYIYEKEDNNDLSFLLLILDSETQQIFSFQIIE